MSLSGMLIARIEDGENLRNAFEISGALFPRAAVVFICGLPFVFEHICIRVSLIQSIYCCAGSHNERMQVACTTQQDLQDWLDLLTKHTHTPAPHTPSYKHQSVCHTVRAEDFLPDIMLMWYLGEMQVKLLVSVSASCPLTLALPPDCQSHTEGTRNNCTTLFPTHPLLGQPTATAQHGGPWSHQAPPNPGA